MEKGLKLHTRLRQVYLRMRVYRSFLKKQRELGLRPLFQPSSYRLLLNGFLTDKKYIYQTDGANLDLYLSDFHARRTRMFNKNYGMIFDRKDIFHRIMQQTNSGLKILGIINDGCFYPEEGESKAIPLNEAIKSWPKSLMLRRVGKSAKVQVAEATENPLSIAFEDIKLSDEDIFQYFAEYCWIVLEARETDPSQIKGKFRPTIENPLVITTARDPENDEVFCAFATQHFKDITLESIPENADVGNSITAAVNIKTGELGEVVAIRKYQNGSTSRKEMIHAIPGLPEVVDGQIIENWNFVKTLVLKTAAVLPMINAASWTVAFVNGRYVIIDGSNSLAVEFAQVHQPIFSNESLKALFANYLTQLKLHINSGSEIDFHESRSL